MHIIVTPAQRRVRPGVIDPDLPEMNERTQKPTEYGQTYTQRLLLARALGILEPHLSGAVVLLRAIHLLLRGRHWRMMLVLLLLLVMVTTILAVVRPDARELNAGKLIKGKVTHAWPP